MEQDAIKGILVDFKAERYTLPEAIERINEVLHRPPTTPATVNPEPAHSNP